MHIHGEDRKRSPIICTKRELSANSLFTVGVKNCLSKISTGQLLHCMGGITETSLSHLLFLLLSSFVLVHSVQLKNNSNKPRLHLIVISIFIFFYHQCLSFNSRHKGRIKMFSCQGQRKAYLKPFSQL